MADEPDNWTIRYARQVGIYQGRWWWHDVRDLIKGFMSKL